MRKEAESGLSVKLNEGGAEDSLTAAATMTKEESPPSYGAQHLQDALWEGGNKALPPRWRQFDSRGGITEYQDDNLVMTSSRRPSPGVRLDSLGQIPVPECEWHISPLGRSYFVNHNTRTTSWTKPTPEHPPESLRPECIIKAHSNVIWSLAYLGTSRSVVSASGDGSIRHWRRDGTAIGQPWRSDGGAVGPIAVSPDETMVVSGSSDGKIRLWDIKKGRIIGDPWEGHNDDVRCIDWSPNGKEIASGSDDGTIRRWDPSTGRQIGRPVEAGQGWVYFVKYSPQGDKFASSATDGMIRVWSTGGNSKLLVEITANDGRQVWVESLCWTKDGTSIFSGSRDHTIRKWRSIDGEELFVLRGHTGTVRSLCLSLDGCILISASHDCSVRFWDLNTSTSKPVGEPLLHDDGVRALVMSPDGQYLASGGIDKRIYLWNLEAALKQSGIQVLQDGNAASNAKLKEHVSSSRDILDVSIKYKQRPNNTSTSRHGDDFWGNDSSRGIGGSAPVTSSSPRRRNFFDIVRFDTRPVHVAPKMPHQRHRWNFSFSTKRTPSVVDVAAAQDVDRIYVFPPTAEEMTAAMQDETGSAVNDSAHQDGPSAGVQGPMHVPPAQTTQGQKSVAETEVVGCCGFVLVRNRPMSQ